MLFRSLLFSLQLAAQRGVRVRVFTNGPKTEAWVLHHAQRSFYATMLASGIEILESIEDYNHAKALVVDGRVVVVDFARIPGKSSAWVLGHVRAGQEVVEREIRECGFEKVGEVQDLLVENYLVVYRKSKAPAAAR